MLIGLVAAALIGARRVEGLELGRPVSVPMLDRAILGEKNIDDGTDPFEARTGLVVFPDRVSVASARELTRIVIFDLSKTIYVDDSAAVMIGQLVNTAMARSARRFVIAGLQGDVADSLNALDLLARVPPEHFAADLDEAKRIVRPMLRGD